MKLSNSKLFTTALVTAGVIGFAGIAGSAVFAAETGDYPLIIQNLAEKFNVDAEDVKQVFEDTREERHDARLDKLVEEGKITAEQRVLLEAKQEEIRAEIEAIKEQDLEREEMHEQIKAIREEFREWAESNGIDLPEKGEGNRPGRRGFGGGRG